MRFNKSTRYALYAAMEMAAAGADETVTASEVAQRFEIPPAVLAKVFQQLVRAGIAIGTRGVGGGYRLARPPSEVTMLDVIQVFESMRRPAGVAKEVTPDPANPRQRRLSEVFEEVDELVRCTFASISLETLASGRNPLHPEFSQPPVGDDTRRAKP